MSNILVHASRDARYAARLCAAAFVATLTGSSLSAQQLPATPASSTGVEAQARVGVTDERTLSLSDAVASVLANNNDIAVARVSTEQSVFAVAGARGAFDPRLNLQTSFQRQVTPVSSLIGGAADKLNQGDLLWGPELSGIAPTLGTNYRVAFTTRRQTTDNLFTTLNPQFPSALTLSATQPLLRGLRIDEPRRQIELARKNSELSESQFRQRVMDVVQQAEQAYWDLAFAEQNVRVQRQGLELAREQAAGSQRLADQGVGAPIDVVEAEAQVATLEQNLLTAEVALTRAENALKVLMLADRSAALWSSALRPTTMSRAGAVFSSVEDAVQKALDSRPELTQFDISDSTNETNLRFLRDQVRPQVNLVATYTSSGLAGRALSAGPNPLTAGTQPLIERLNALSALQGLAPLASSSTGTTAGTTSPLDGGLSSSLARLATQDFPTFQVGIQVALPFRNQASEANVATAVAEGRRIRYQRQRAAEQVEAEVRNALQARNAADEKLRAAGRARGAAEAQYESEGRRFEAGTSTMFLVLQRQTALINARTRYAQAQVELSKSIADLDRATGQILSTHNVTLR